MFHFGYFGHFESRNVLLMVNFHILRSILRRFSLLYKISSVIKHIYNTACFKFLHTKFPKHVIGLILHK